MNKDAEVLIAGAGLAGLSAAVSLSAAGVRTVIAERKPYVGGRAYSYPHPALDEVIDSQHVLLGCCTNLLDLCRRSGADAHLRWYDSIPFLEPATADHDPRTSTLAAGPGPAAALGFLRAPMLTLRDKLGIARGLREFLGGPPVDGTEGFDQWLQRTGQTGQAIRHFWEPVVVATLNDTLDRCSTKYAAKVFYEAFLKSHEGGRMAVPTEPLSEFYARAGMLATEQGAELRLRASIDRIQRDPDGWSAQLSDGQTLRAQKLLLALPFEQVQRLLLTLPEDDHARQSVTQTLAQFSHAPITTIHLWFDRSVCEVEQAALLDTRIQWLFNKTRIRRDEPRWRTPAGEYLELVISASFAELRQTREQILASAIDELARFFPGVRQAKIVKSGILKEARATFSVVPGLDALRPQAALGNDLFVAGDWIATGWPSTMEGAVRSGRIAAEAITGSRHLLPELPASGIARLFG